VGVDIGRRELRVCVRPPDEVSGADRDHRVVGTTTPDLLNLVVRLRGLAVTHVAMESTGCTRKLCTTCVRVILEETHSPHSYSPHSPSFSGQWPR
jgi:hypothetical protein